MIMTGGRGLLVVLLAMVHIITTLVECGTSAAESEPPCYDAWSATTSYVGGSMSSTDGVNYVAAFWTQGDNPSTNSGPTGTGKPWVALEVCNGYLRTGSTTTTSSPSTRISPTPPSCIEWVEGLRYVSGQVVIYQGSTYTCLVNYTAYPGAGWNPTVASIFKPGGTCSGISPTSSSTNAPSSSSTIYNSSTAATSAVPALSSSSTSFTPTSTTAQSGSRLASSVLFSPYKDVTQGFNWSTNKMGSAFGPMPASMPPGNDAISFAFATGTCGSESWAGIPPAVMAENLQSFAQAGKKYVISTGGVNGAFACSDDKLFDSFIKTYSTETLIGIDFDIEVSQSAADIDNLVTRVKNAQSSYPNLRFSFTIATLAPSQSGSSVAVDMGAASPNPLGATGIAVMNSIKKIGLTNYYINLMAMDYGSTSVWNCVVVNGSCQMGESAIQAAMNLHGYYNLPYSQIELCPMSGPNDTPGETFTIEDVARVSKWSKANGIAALHFWSFDRDLNPPLAYTRQFVQSLE